MLHFEGGLEEDWEQGFGLEWKGTSQGSLALEMYVY